jgi:hypothetical protein
VRPPFFFFVLSASSSAQWPTRPPFFFFFVLSAGVMYQSGLYHFGKNLNRELLVRGLGFRAQQLQKVSSVILPMCICYLASWRPVLSSAKIQFMV